jgi:general secretion pathway protein B
MSFILDALRKSEHDRQRQTGPGLAEMPVAVARPRTNVWATAAIALLLVNLIGVGVLLLRRASHDAPAASPKSATPAAAAAPAASPAVAPAPTNAPPPTARASVTQTLPQPVLQQPAPTTPSYMPSRNPLENEVSGGSEGIDAGIAARAASVPEGPPAVSRAPAATTIGGSVKYEPLREAEAAVAKAVAADAQAQARAPAQPALPTADEVSARGGVPQLHLDLHVYGARAQDRFIFVNSRKYREGDTLQEGPVVEQITQRGAVLNYNGSRFILSRD